MGNSQGEAQELIPVDKNEMLAEKAVKLCLQFEVSRKYDSQEIRFNTNTFQLQSMQSILHCPSC